MLVRVVQMLDQCAVAHARGKDHALRRRTRVLIEAGNAMGEMIETTGVTAIGETLRTDGIGGVVEVEVENVMAMRSAGGEIERV